MEQQFDESLSEDIETAENDLYPANGKWLVYHQFNRSYFNIIELIKDLKRIKELKFNAVLVSPFHPTCTFKVDRGNKKNVTGSLYAIKQYWLNNNVMAINTSFINEKTIKEYTTTAKKLRLIPVFDLVLRHVAKDIDLAKNGLKQEWFKPYEKNKLMNDVMDFGYCKDLSAKQLRMEQKRIEVFTNKHWQDIFKNFWQPYIKHCFDKLGFCGVRLDAVKYLPMSVLNDICKYINSLSKDNPKLSRPIIFAELLFGKTAERVTFLKEMSKASCCKLLTHITNSLYSRTFSPHYRELPPHSRHPRWKLGRAGELETPEILGLLNSVVKEGSVGFGASHDTSPLVENVCKEIAKENVIKKLKGCRLNRTKWRQQKAAEENSIKTILTNGTEKEKMILRERIKKAMKEKIAAVAFTSGGGFLMVCGDEFGHWKRKSTFDYYRERWSDWCKPKNPLDISLFVRNLNNTLRMLPNDKITWVEHVYLPKHPNLMCVIQHYGEAFSKQPCLIIVNLLEAPQELNAEILKKIAQQSLLIESRKYDRKLLKTHLAYVQIIKIDSENIFLVGNINNTLFSNKMNLTFMKE